MQATLPPATALIDLLEYTHFTPPIQGKGKMQEERHVVAFVVRPDRPIVWLDLGPAAPIATAVDRWRAAFVDNQPAQGTGPADPAVELRRLVWQPLERWLDGVHAVLVSPDGALARFPLAALPGKRPGTYLIEELPIALVPVPQLLPQLLQGPGGHRRRLAAYLPAPGGRHRFRRSAEAAPRRPEPNSQGMWPPEGAGSCNSRRYLPQRLEMKDVRTSFQQTNPGGAVDEVRGTAATEAALRSLAPGKHYLHLATHGFFAPPELRVGPESARRHGQMP